MYRSLSIHLLKNILSAFKFWQLMSKAAINISVWVFVWTCFQLTGVNTKDCDYWIMWVTYVFF